MASGSSAALWVQQHDDPLSTRVPRQGGVSPEIYQDLFAMYKKYEASFWTTEDLMGMRAWWNRTGWASMGQSEQTFVTKALAVLAAPDVPGLAHLASTLAQEIPAPEARMMLEFMAVKTNIHADAHASLLEQYVRSSEQKKGLFDFAFQTLAWEDRRRWAAKWVDHGNSVAARVVAFASVEGIFNRGLLGALAWLQQRDLVPGFTLTGEYVRHDKNVHVQFVGYLYGLLQARLPPRMAEDIIREAVVIERQVICNALQCHRIGIDDADMTGYLEFVADRALVTLGYDKLFGTGNPLNWLPADELQATAAFLEQRRGHRQASFRKRPRPRSPEGPPPTTVGMTAAVRTAVVMTARQGQPVLCAGGPPWPLVRHGPRRRDHSRDRRR